MNILVYASDSREGNTAFGRGVSEALLRGWSLTLGAYIQLEPDRSPGQAVDLAQTRLDGLAATAREKGVVSASVKAIPSLESAGTVLLDLAADLPADLLIIGLRRRSPVGKLVLGSVSQDILLGADCPVLAVKSTDETE